MLPAKSLSLGIIILGIGFIFLFAMVILMMQCLINTVISWLEKQTQLFKRLGGLNANIVLTNCESYYSIYLSRKQGDANEYFNKNDCI